jgi:hypothetical protein
MMDQLRVSGGGFPIAADITAAQAYLNGVRPVAVKDFFVQAPIPEPINFQINGLDAVGDGLQAFSRETWNRRDVPLDIRHPRHLAPAVNVVLPSDHRALGRRWRDREVTLKGKLVPVCLERGKARESKSHVFVSCSFFKRGCPAISAAPGDARFSWPFKTREVPTVLKTIS